MTNFVATFTIDNIGGTSTGSDIQLGFNGSHNVDIEWTNGGGYKNYTSGTDGLYSGVAAGLSVNGDYQVTISGSFAAYGGGLNNNSVFKVKNISQYGQLALSNDFKFDKDTRIIIGDWTATDTLDLTQNGRTSLKEFMYKQLYNLSIDFSKWNISSITTMEYLFSSCNNFTGGTGLNTWDMTNVENIVDMFLYCRKFNQDLSSWVLSSLIIAQSAFMGCFVFNTNVTNWKPVNCTNYNQMFQQCDSFTGVGLNTWDFSKAIQLNQTFHAANGLGSIDLSGLNFFNCEYFHKTFSESNFNGNLSNWVLKSSGVNLRHTFGYCPNFTGTGLNTWNVTGVTTMKELFLNCPKLDGDNITDWETQNCNEFTNIGIPDGAFKTNVDFGSDSTTAWIIKASATDYQDILANDTDNNYKFIPHSNSDYVQLVKSSIPDHKWFPDDFICMCASGVTTFAIGGNGTIVVNWDFNDPNVADVTATGNGAFVTTTITGGPKKVAIRATSNLADGLTSESQFDITDVLQYGIFDVSWTNPINFGKFKATSATDTFVVDSGSMGGLDNDISINFSKWDTTNVTTMHSLFKNNSGIRGLNGLDVQNVENFDEMFDTAMIHDMDLSSWSTSNATSMVKMFNNTSGSGKGLDNWDVSQVTSMEKMFNDCTLFEELNLDNWKPINCQDFTSFSNHTYFTTDASYGSYTTDTWIIPKNATNKEDIFNNSENYKFIPHTNPKYVQLVRKVISNNKFLRGSATEKVSKHPVASPKITRISIGRTKMP